MNICFFITSIIHDEYLSYREGFTRPYSLIIEKQYYRQMSHWLRELNIKLNN